MDRRVTDMSNADSPHPIDVLRARAEEIDVSSDESLEINAHILELDADNRAAANRLGRGLMARGRRQEAIDVFTEAARRDPRNSIARRRLAELNSASWAPPPASVPMRLRHQVDLRAYHRQAAEVTTERDAVARAKSHRSRPGEEAVAVIYAERAIELAPDSSGAWACLAACQRRNQLPAEAVAAAKHSLQIEPALSRNPAGHTVLLAAQVDVGSPDPNLASQLASRTRDGYAQNAAGRALKVLGELERAERCFRIAVELDQMRRDSLGQLDGIALEYRALGREPDAAALEAYVRARRAMGLDARNGSP